MILLEAAPTQLTQRCNSTVFRARHRDDYLQMFRELGLRVRAITGVDPAPFRYLLLPLLPRLPRPLSVASLALVTALSAPIDAFFGRMAADFSWHAVFVLQHAEAGSELHAK
jgi:hypothetical protein